MNSRRLLLMAGLLPVCGTAAFADQHPNIIFILADDLGYGDLTAVNERSKIATPNIDRISAEGVTFLDAHSSSSVSTPTRYGVLTGRYNWRSELKWGVMAPFDDPMIAPGRTTMASMLQQQGYQTACFGKWHLGMHYETLDGKRPHDNRNECNVDFSKEITGGPADVGFQYFFGVNAPNYPPYCYIENKKTVGTPSVFYPFRGMDCIGGHGIENWELEDVLPTVIQHTTDYIAQAAKKQQPFFVYLPLTSPHTPIVPTAEFKGKTGLNKYADFVKETDAMVGKVLQALKDNGVDENTIVVFTSDNGCSPNADFAFLGKKGHDPSYIYRGMKSDLYEGGHRMPCFVRWPERIKPHTVKQTICLTDFMATFAELTGYELADNEAEDSYNILPLLTKKRERKAIRPATVHHSVKGEFAIRQGKWKLLLANYSGGWSAPTMGHRMDERFQLFDLEKDPEETTNLYAEHKELAEQMRQLLVKYVMEGRSTPGAKQQNDPIRRAFLRSAAGHIDVKFYKENGIDFFENADGLWPQIKPWLKK